MKKAALLTLAVSSALLIVSCLQDKDVTQHADYTAPELSVSQEELTLAKEAGSSATVTISTDQEVISAEVDYSAKVWLACSLSGNTVTIKAIQTNPEGEPRTGVVHIFVGEKGVTAEKNVTVTQEKGIKATLSISPAALVLQKEAGLTGTIAVTTNQDVVTLAVPEEAQSWLGASYAGGKITVTTLEENASAVERSAEITVTAGVEPVTATAILSITQKGADASVIGSAYGTEGVIIWQNPDNPKEVKIISAKRGTGLPWSKTATQTGCTGDDATGVDASAKIRAMADYNTNQYGIKFCDGLGEGWYMPSLKEIKYELYPAYCGKDYDTATKANYKDLPADEKANIIKFEDTLAKIGGDMINTKISDSDTGGDSMWAARETSDGSKGYYVRFGNKASDSGAKTGTARYMRCVKVVTLP